MTPKYKTGDWIRFMRGNELVIGVVQYVDQESIYWRCEYITDIGRVIEESVLEGRCKALGGSDGTE